MGLFSFLISILNDSYNRITIFKSGEKRLLGDIVPNHPQVLHPGIKYTLYWKIKILNCYRASFGENLKWPPAVFIALRKLNQNPAAFFSLHSCNLTMVPLYQILYYMNLLK